MAIDARTPFARRVLRAALAALVVIATGAPGPAGGAELSGSAQVSVGSTDVDGEETDVVDQQYSFDLFQRFTPYLSLRAGASVLDLATETPGGPDFDRRSREPRLELLYNRSAVSARLAVRDRVAEGSSAADEFEVRSYLGHLVWRTPWGPVVTVDARDESNVADVALFGRDTGTRTVTGSLLWNRRLWSGGYSVQRLELDNRLSGLELDQTRHDLRFDAGRRFLDEHLAVSFGSRVTRLERSETVPLGADPAEPVPARQGLFAVDTSPAEGSLEPAPGLVDGELQAPAASGAEIGGANTFRNLGVDLGLALPVTRLEVTVDAPSGADVLWEVWHSPDNLLWQRVPGVVRSWDPALLRYTLAFPETTDRFFKAVNVTANPAVDVAVTELRALRDVDRLAPGGGEATLYQADLSAFYRPSERFSLRVDVGASEDENLTGSVARRRFEEVHGGARMEVALLRDLRFRAGYRYQDYENRVEPVLLRTESLYDAGLAWTPLPTVEARLTTSTRDESDERQRVRLLRTTRLAVDTELLPDLDLLTELERSSLEDSLSGFERDGWTLRQLLAARPTVAWTVTGGWSLARFEDGDGRVLLDRWAVDFQADWLATPYLTLTGAWAWSVDDAAAGRTFLRQRYAASWSPGKRLSTSLSWEFFEDEDLRETTNASAGATYRFTRQLTLFGSLTRSTFDEIAPAEESETTSFRTGLSLVF
ncbi:MAG: hypothetical protein ACLF0P_00895 [Thermoanaerobaculia bacterium]